MYSAITTRHVGSPANSGAIALCIFVILSNALSTRLSCVDGGFVRTHASYAIPAQNPSSPASSDTHRARVAVVPSVCVVAYSPGCSAHTRYS